MAHKITKTPSSVPQHTSLWYRNEDTLPHFEMLQGEHTADVCIIGGGITGLTLAYQLKDEGKRVLLLEKERLASGTTGHTSAHLDPLTDIGLSRMLETMGREKASALIRGGMDALDFIDKTSRAHGIDCHFKRVPAYYYCDRSPEQEKRFTETVTSAEALGLEPTVSEGPAFPADAIRALRFDLHARFDPFLYVAGLARVLKNETSGSLSLHEHSFVREMQQHKDHVELKTDVARVVAKQVVLATHYPTGLHLSIQARVFPYRSYLLAAHVSENIPEGLYWDLASPYHYLRRVDTQHGPLLLAGGEDHKTGHGKPLESQRRLERFVRERFDVREITHEWSHQYYPSDRGAPYIGSLPFESRVFVATGFDGTGLTLGTLAARLLKDQLTGRDHELLHLVSPERVAALSSARKLVSENLDVAKHMIGDRLKSALGKQPAVKKLKRGDGVIVRMNGKPCALHRDANGKLHALSAICTHAHCIVQWNGSESTWDCPCHGGRFGADGSVLNGPPTEPLNPA